MQTTKQQILTLLKRTGSITVDEAAGALAVASMTARQHLVGLERDGLVQAEKVRRQTGRPHYLYHLTLKGDEMFPRRYDLLAQVILEEASKVNVQEIDGLTPIERQSLLLRRAADRLAEQYRFQVQGRSLRERVAAVTEVLQMIGGFAEWYPNGQDFEIRDYNCVFATLAPVRTETCEGHSHLLARLLDCPIELDHDFEGREYSHCCRYVVRSVNTSTQAGEGLLVNG